MQCIECFQEMKILDLHKDLWIYGQNNQIAKYKSWGHDPIWYFSCLCRKFTELRALLFLSSSTQTSQNQEIYPKMPMFEQLKKQVPVNFDPSLERSWYELFGIIKAHGPKYQPPSSTPYYVFSKDAILESVPSISSDVLGLY